MEGLGGVLLFRGLGFGFKFGRVDYLTEPRTEAMRAVIN